MSEAPARPILRYHGGKWVLSAWIISHFPEHRVYTECFGGGGSVLLKKPRAYAEVYNDLDGEIVNLFRVMRDAGEELRRRLELTPYSRAEFHFSFEPAEDPIERARRTVVRSFMGFGGNLTRPNRDQSPQRTGWRDNTSQARHNYAAEFASYVEALPAIAARLRGVLIDNRPALAVMAKHDGAHTLHYVDPPYVHATRGFDCGGSHRGYRHEMTDDQHREMAAFLRELKGAVILSGYACDLYDRELFPEWRKEVRSTFADGARSREECLWIKPARRREKRMVA